MLSFTKCVLLVLALATAPVAAERECRSALLSPKTVGRVDVRVPFLPETDVFSDEIRKQVSKNAQTAPRGGSDATPTIPPALKVTVYFALWYILNILYNIQNKKILNALPLPLAVGTLQLGVGSTFVAMLWATGLRKAPILTPNGKGALKKVGFYHSAGQLLSMVSLGAGAVSFTHIVKALEPFFSAAVSALYLGKWMRPQVYAALIPVVGGVATACFSDLSFTWLGFYSAMGSNLMFALRAVMSKAAMTSPIGEETTPTNVFGVVTIYSFLLALPVAFLSDWSSFGSLFRDAITSTGKSNLQFVKDICVSGLVHYLNNEVMYMALDSVHPVTLAVGNTMKRVFIIVASVIAFNTKLTTQTITGSAVGIAGVLLYSLTKQYYEKLDAVAA